MRDSDHLIYFITAIVCFVFGIYSFWSCSTSFDITSPQAELYHDSRTALASRRVPTQDLIHSQNEEIQARKTFQELLRKHQQLSNDCSRVLIVPIQFDNGETLSWIDSLEVMAMGLKVALSTARRLIVQISGDKEQSFCHFVEHEIYCQFIEKQGPSNCHSSTDPPTFPLVWTSPLRQGVQEHAMSDFFNVRYYGSDDVAVLPNVSAWPWPKSWLLGGGLSWERSWGAFWIRSQLLYYLTVSKLNDPDNNHGETVSDPSRITLIWDTAAQQSLKRKFARDSDKTHHSERIRALANYLRDEYMKEIKVTNDITPWKMVLVIITDDSTTEHNQETTIPLQSWNEEWQVSIVKIDPHKKPERHVLEYTYSSELLIGSFSSPFFRVLTALHKAKWVPFNTSFGRRRYWSLDIEWLEAFQGV